MNQFARLMQSIPLPAQPIVKAVMTAQERYGLFSTPAGGAVVVGLSGGADSVCLLHVLWLLAPLWGLSLHAAHLDHALRPESATDADFAAELADKLGVAFHVHRLADYSLQSDPRGIEAAAREKRYEFLASVADAVASPPYPPTVAVAHHMDDQAETVLMNLVRGGSLRGLSGMSWIRRIASDKPRPVPNDEPSGEIRLVRPLLGVRRTQIHAYLRAYALPHREDRTNEDTSRLRNRIRHETLPMLARLNPQIVETLARTAQLLAAEAERSEALDRQALDNITVEAQPPDRYILGLKQFRHLSLAAQRGVLRQACQELGLDMRDVGFENIESAIWQIRAGQTSGHPRPLSKQIVWTAIAGSEHFPAILSLHRSHVLPYPPPHPHLSNLRPDIPIPCPLTCAGKLSVTHEWELRCQLCKPDDLPADWRERGRPWRAFLDADSVKRPALTVPAPGMSFAPLGMAGHHKQLGDYFTDRKTPPALRPEWPIIVDTADNSIAWVCGFAIGHHARITADTRRVLCLEWVRTHDISPQAARSQNSVTYSTHKDFETS